MVIFQFYNETVGVTGVLLDAQIMFCFRLSRLDFTIIFIVSHYFRIMSALVYKTKINGTLLPRN